MKKRRVPVDKELCQKIVIRLDLPCYTQLHEYAFVEGYTPSVIVRHLIKRFLASQRKFDVAPLKGLTT